MTQLWRCAFACTALQALLCCSCCHAQVSGFLSIDCGSNSSTTFTDANKIEWISDADLMMEGEPIALPGGEEFVPYNTMRVFRGDQSKYCYNLSNSAVTKGAFFLVRAWFSTAWTTASLNDTFMSSNGQNFQFKLLIDADVWRDVYIPKDSSHPQIFYEMYTQVLHSSISVCLARSTPDGDDPFISALELRPLPNSLTAIHLMDKTSRRFISAVHNDMSLNNKSVIRYPDDTLDRLWQPSTLTIPALTTTATTAISKLNDQDKMPEIVLETAFHGEGTRMHPISYTYSGRGVSDEYYCVIHFAEIDPAVNASGQREFNIFVNGELTPLNEKPIDVFAEVGAYAPYEIVVPGPIQPTNNGQIFFNFSPTAGSLFSPFYSAFELFLASNNTISIGSFPSDVIVIEDLKASMNLSSYSGDPCLPNGFGYPWLKCTEDTTLGGPTRIMSISLPNNYQGGRIPNSINDLTMVHHILLNGNNLIGSIPDMSALANLETLDLSNNQLSGSIPESLTTLKNLKILYLENNNLTGRIPPTLLERKSASTLDFRYSGNLLCQMCNITSSSSSTPKRKNHHGLIIGATITILFLVTMGIGMTIICLCKKKTQYTSKKSFKNSHPSQQKLPLCERVNPTSVIDTTLPVLSLKEFTFQTIKIATNNFSTQLGKGGFGPVYKGNLKDGRTVAIKVASSSSLQGAKEFISEVDHLSRVYHKNLVGLLGYCNKDKLVLVYEFMSNGSLYDCLHGPFAKISPLSWGTRLRILVDAAQGFDYLHHGCNPQIIHRDIKSSNILLNDKLEAKIADFGISRNSFVNNSGAPTTTLMGSMGYMDPIYLSTMRLTEKVDVYSFGIVLLEVVCGKKAIFVDASQDQTHIVEWVKPYIDRGIIDEIIDPNILNQYNDSFVWKVLEVALACVQVSSLHRPTMSDVYLELKEAMQMEIQRDQSNVLSDPYNGISFDSSSITHVQAR